MHLSRIASVPRLGFRTLKRILTQKTRVTIRRTIPLMADEKTLGCIQISTWTRHHVDLQGWLLDDRHLVGAEDTAGGSRTANATLVVPAGSTRFQARLSRLSPDQPVQLLIADRNTRKEFLVAPPGPWRNAMAHILTLPAALRLIARHGLDILRFIQTGDAGLSVSLRDAFGFTEAGSAAPLLPGAALEPFLPQTEPPRRPVIVVVPVHNAVPQVARLLERLRCGVGIEHRIVLIDDGSSDPRIAPMLAGFAARHPDRVRIETFEMNRGFVAAVNRGLDVAAGLGEHVIILNTDALPPNGWAGRLIAPILEDPDIASVTPVSNNAEIASIPENGVHSEIGSNFVDAIDAIAKTLGKEWRQVEIPTGIGFAMALNRRFLDRIGGFDHAFGRGYGEEVDWCQRASEIGGKHVLATSLFIGHEGGASFGTTEKTERLAASAAIIRRRYPSYDGAVRDWAEAAPHAVQRMILTMPYLEATAIRPTPIFLAHSLGGGAEIVLRHEIDLALAAGAPGVVVLRTGGATRWRLEVEGQGFRHACRVAESETLARCLAPVRRRRVIYSCGAGARDPRDVPNMLATLSRSASSTLEVRLHDFFPITPSYCLLNSHGRYRGVPDADDTDPAHNLPAIAGRKALPLGEWRRLWRDVMVRAERITAYSATSAALLETAYPEASNVVRVEPHEFATDKPMALAPGGKAIGVLGGINQAKGAEVLLGLAAELRKSGNSRKMVIVGGLDPAYRLPRPHRVTGPYRRRDIARIARAHDIGVWLIPSIWPETFSFATHEALATGLPVLTFALGAQAEAARAATNGQALPMNPFDSATLVAAIEKAFDRPTPSRRRGSPRVVSEATKALPWR